MYVVGERDQWQDILAICYLIRGFVTPNLSVQEGWHNLSSNALQDQPILHTLHFVFNSTASPLWEKKSWERVPNPSLCQP